MGPKPVIDPFDFPIRCESMTVEGNLVEGITVDTNEAISLIENCIVVTVDESNRPHTEASVLLAGDEIVGIGDPKEFAANIQVDERIDSSGHVVFRHSGGRSVDQPRTLGGVVNLDVTVDGEVPEEAFNPPTFRF